MLTFGSIAHISTNWLVAIDMKMRIFTDEASARPILIIGLLKHSRFVSE